MALNNKSSFGHFWLRFLGLTGLALMVAGLPLWLAIRLEIAGLGVTLVGLALALAWLVGEMQGVLQMTMSRRGAVGGSVVLQVLLATVLLANVNIFSFFHYCRTDWTRDRAFTLDPTITSQLTQLRGLTEIIVYQRHTPFGQSADNRQDNYDAAAQRKIVEKVKDLAELFQDLGPRFRVQVLDIQDNDFKDHLDKIRSKSPLLAEAIEKAPDNSIFFHAQGKTESAGRVQRLSFHDIYQLDKKASMAAHGNQGNLVLNYQDVRAFAGKVLAIDEKRPRIGFAVCHEYLGVDGHEKWGMSGVKKSLEARGFECVDIILKQFPQNEPTVLTHNEHKYERLELQVAGLDRKIKDLEEEIAKFSAEQQEFSTLDVAQLNKKYALVRGPYAVTWTELDAFRKKNGFYPPHARVDSEEVKDYYLKDLARTLEDLETSRKKESDNRAKAIQERDQLPVDNLAEQRRLTDLRAKFNRMLADCDLLVVQRATFLNVAIDEVIPPSLYKLDNAQVEAIKDFMKAGKPVLFCLGPMNDLREDPFGRGEDPLEEILTSLGVQMPNQVVFFNSEIEALENYREGFKLARAPEVPPLDLEWKAGAGKFSLYAQGAKTAPNVIRDSLKLSARAFSDKFPSDLKLRNPRPVYVMNTDLRREAVAGAIGLHSAPQGFGPVLGGCLLFTPTRKVDEKAIFLMTSAESWNDDNPYPTPQRIPRLERTKAEDAAKGTEKERREGPFPVAVALETQLPAKWFDDKSPAAASLGKVRLAVIGSGSVFMADHLSPMKEKLLLDSVNWLLGRDDLLARQAAEPWSFPRVEMSADEKKLWIWAAVAALPCLFGYLGGNVLLVRRMR